MSRHDDRMLEAEIAEYDLNESGLLDPDQPTELAHHRYIKKAESEFTPFERRKIRWQLGLAEEKS